MVTYAGFTQMGSQPVASRARAVDTGVSERSRQVAASAAHLVWHVGTGLGHMAIAAQAKPASRTFTAVPDTNGTRWLRGIP